jgi:anaerobic ribonucleoside-triphosphate reductase
MQISLSFEKEFDQLYEEYINDKKKHKLLEIEGVAPNNLDIALMSKKYFTQRLADISINQNANSNGNISPNNYSAEVPKGLMKLDGYYLLWDYSRKRFGLDRANELIKAIWDGDIYFHDASGAGINQPYCWAFSTAVLLANGRNYGQLYSKIPKRSDSFISQVIELTMDLSQEYAGAISPADMIINYCWFAKQENLNNYQILNDLQRFVHVVNNMFRVGGESPFTNISLFDRINLQKVFGEYRYPDGTEIDIEYIMSVQKIFGEWFAKGDPISELPYRFPIVTINLSKDNDGNILDQDFLNWTCKVNLKRGCFNLYINDGSKIASCCRLINNKERMKYRIDSFGNGGLNIGSSRVVTVNLPRIALQSNGNEEKFIEILKQKLQMCEDLLIVHRKEILDRRIKKGFLKFYKPLDWFSIKQLFSTFGIIGNYEMLYFMNKSNQEKDGQEFQLKVLQTIEEFAQEASERNSVSFNVEEIPGESCAPNLVKKDKLFFGEKCVPFELYSNQYIPLIQDALMIDRIKITGKFMDILSGGGILHLNLSEPIEEEQTMKKIIEFCVQNKVSHFAINYGYGICENDHTTICGNSNVCSVCQGDIKEWMTRIVGYFTKISSWNKTRREFEFPNRKFMKD